MVLRSLILGLIFLWSNVAFSQTFQKESVSIDHANYSVEVGKKNQGSPYFILKNNITSELQRIDLGASDSDVFNYNSIAEFQTTNLPSLGKFFTIVVAAPGGSDTEFEVSIAKLLDSKLQLINIPVWDLMVEDGFYLGKINDQYGVGAVSWKYVSNKNGNRTQPHYYRINIYHLKNDKFILLTSFQTKNKYNDGTTALKEFNLYLDNQLAKFNIYQKYR